MSFHLKSERLAGVIQTYVVDIFLALGTLASLIVIALVTTGVL
jgi:hypothetical protein